MECAQLVVSIHRLSRGTLINLIQKARDRLNSKSYLLYTVFGEESGEFITGRDLCCIPVVDGGAANLELAANLRITIRTVVVQCLLVHNITLEFAHVSIWIIKY